MCRKVFNHQSTRKGDFKMNIKLIALFSLMGILLSSASYASDQPPQVDIRTSKVFVSQVVSTMTGTNGAGISACKNDGTVAVPGDDFQPCIIIYAKTEDAARSLITLWPTESKVNGFFIIVSYAGNIVSEPRASGGN